MAISFQNNLFKNPFVTSGIENLKPKVNQERNNSDKTEDKNTKANTQDTKATMESEIKQSLLNINPIDKAQNSLANVMLRNLADALEGGYDEYANMMIDSIIQNSKLPASSANAPGSSKGGVYIGSIFNTASIEFTQSLTYTLSYNSQSGEYSQSLQYSSSFVATFNAEFTDKNGNKMNTQNQFALGKNFENQLTNGQESISSALKSLLEGQTFNIDFDGDFNDFGEGLQNRLNNMLFLFETNDASKALQDKNSNLQTSKEDKMAFLQNLINSSLEMFVGIPKDKENQNNPILQDWLKSPNTLTISTSYEQYSAQWIGKKLDNSESGLWWYGSYSSKSASFKFEA
ncbi:MULTISPECIES: hypothetical protein [Helicobacter]|uniref:hypothetical protein n=1 Tax=Helicobacter TaxID=209 RepID=UPI00263801D4|nr:hypothetical protein [Helicobacter sp. UBA3407]